MARAQERTEALILSTHAVADADLVVVLLTPSAGKLRLLAKHARRSRRRFPGGLSMGALGEAAYVRGRGQLLHLDEFRPLHDVTVLGRDLDRFAYAAYVCELADVVLWESQPDEHGYEVVRAVLGRLIRHPPTAALLRCFELQLLGTLGELPLFDRCCVCGTVVDPSPEDTIGFDIVRGGAMCRLHAEAAPRIDVGVARLCTALGGLPTDPQLVPSFGDADLTVRKALRDLLLDLVARRTQRPLRSVEFFTKLKQFAPLPRT